jgi:hypothetical protein
MIQHKKAPVPPMHPGLPRAIIYIGGTGITIKWYVERIGDNTMRSQLPTCLPEALLANDFLLFCPRFLLISCIHAEMVRIALPDGIFTTETGFGKS